MKKNLLEEEIKRFHELINYDSNNNGLISENKIFFNYEEDYDENNRILEMHHNAINNDLITEDEDDPIVRKRFDVGGKIKGQKHPRLFGKHGSGAQLDMGLDYKRYKEIDKELNSGSDLLAKMNSDIGGNKDWAMIPTNVKSALANGFNEFLQVAAKSEYLKTLSRQKRKDLRNIFKKSQRWKFEIVDLKNNLSEPDEGKKKATKIKPELTVTFNGENGSPEETKAIQEMRQTINEINTVNCEGSTIAAPQCNALVGQKLKITFDDGTTTDLVQPIVREVDKGALQTAVVYEMMSPQTYQQQESSVWFLEDTKEIVIPNEASGFKRGSDVVDVTYVDKVVQKIYDQLMDTTFELKDKKSGEVIVTKTGRDIIEDNNQGLKNSKILFEFIDTISSASNVWVTDKNGVGKALDFTHTNDGNKVKDFDSLPTTGSDESNKKLAVKRNKNLTYSVISALMKMPGIEQYTEFSYSQEVRITDTGGKVDEVATKEGLNPGQYAGFKVGFIAYVEEGVVKAAKKGIKGKLGQSLIRLVWVGAPETGIDIDFEFNFDFWPGGKNKILHKNLFTGQLQPGGAWWSKNLRGYNKEF